MLRDADGRTVGWFVRTCGAVPGASALLAAHVSVVPAE
jgi:hypothetical protein